MPSILNLKFKGNKSFVAFSNLNDTEALTKTWKVCTKVASYLEQGQRLENLSWRLWHLQNLMVDTDNAKSKREFKKLSKCMGDKLDKEKGRSIEELEAPDFKRNHSTEMIRKRAEEKERDREASQNAQPGTIKRMQFTFSVDQSAAAPVVNSPPAKKLASAESKDPAVAKRSHANGRRAATSFSVGAGAAADNADTVIIDDNDNNTNDNDPHRSRKPTVTDPRTQSLHFPPLFSNDFGPSALLYASPTLTTPMNYGEGLNTSHNDGLSIVRPTIELPLDELLTNVDSAESPWSSSNGTNSDLDTRQSDGRTSPHSVKSDDDDEDVIMKPVNDKPPAPAPAPFSSCHESDEDDSDDSNEDSDVDLTTLYTVPPPSQMAREMLPKITTSTAAVAVAASSSSTTTAATTTAKIGQGSGANTPTGRPTLTVRTQTAPNTRSSGPSATATSVSPTILKHNNSAPGGVKAECSNCGATHTPLWRRGLNDELNCNACGLYCKLHKRPRPKSMRNNHGEGRAQAAPRQESIDVMAQCYNCHTTATPLWRKDDEGKTVCNACGLYYKLHGSARPISMKSDVIRKRSRHDARRITAVETPTASPGASRRPSPTRDISPTLAPDSTTQMSYDYHEDSDYRTSQSELMGALGPEANHHHAHHPQGSFSTSFSFPGPYHPDYIMQLYNAPPPDALPFASVDSPEMETIGMNRRTNKRRRMSTDSASEPPSSAVSYSSYNDGFSTSSSATSHSQRSSMEFPFSAYPHYHILRGSGNTFWHPPMLPQDFSPQFIHPPMLPPAEESPMDYLHPPMLPHDEESLLSAYLRAPMLPTDDSQNTSMATLPHSNMFTNDGMYAGGPPNHDDSNMHTF